MILLRLVIFYFTEGKKCKGAYKYHFGQEQLSGFHRETVHHQHKNAHLCLNLPISYDVVELLKTLDKLNHERFAAAKLKA